jgi:hypothetical protein
MDKCKDPADPSQDRHSGDVSIAAESVRSDFGELVALFNRHLDALSHHDSEARRHIAEARAAAERGLRLSNELVALMKTAD